MLGKQVKYIAVTQTLQDIRRLDSGLAARTNKVGFNRLNVAPRSVMEHMESLLTHVEKADTKLVAVETKVDVAAVAAQVGVSCDATIARWIALYGQDLGAIVQKCLHVVSARLASRLLPLETIFSSVGPFRVSAALSLALTPPVVGENYCHE